MASAAGAGAAAQAAWAANWQSVGPYGGSVFRLARCAAEPAVVYTLTQGGVYRSSGGGRTSRDTNRTLSAADYFDLAADPDDPNSASVIDRPTGRQATQVPDRVDRACARGSDRRSSRAAAWRR